MTSLLDIVEDGDAGEAGQQDISDISMLSVGDEVAQSDEVKSSGDDASGGKACTDSRTKIELGKEHSITSK
ncbi:hypothetical protein DSM107010_64210 [Chroococcidiopsis cubana SAG 39.79]|uniref:Uncharacterized protein n=1 Tax=Chroococcidiopsis cubana SAG 39.79 TaxID=388085 RepID=A0AB37UA49_9CYAN|nr:hypothetical protein DSM107010_64210 [Chroococcidiopsis cubana SAG 39.79]